MIAATNEGEMKGLLTKEEKGKDIGRGVALEMEGGEFTGHSH